MSEKYIPKNKLTPAVIINDKKLGIGKTENDNLENIKSSGEHLSPDDAEWYGDEPNPESKEYKDLVKGLFNIINKQAGHKKDFYIGGSGLGTRFVKTNTKVKGWSNPDNAGSYNIYEDGTFEQEDVVQSMQLNNAIETFDDEEWEEAWSKVKMHPWRKERIQALIDSLITIRL